MAPSQFLADQLTLSQTYAHHITSCPPRISDLATALPHSVTKLSPFFIQGMLKPEMIDDLYEDLPDMELETDYNSFRTKQHQRRARRKKDNLKEPSVILEEEKTKSPPSKTLIVPTGTLETENVPERRSALPIFDAPNFNDWSTDKDIMLAEVVIDRSI